MLRATLRAAGTLIAAIILWFVVATIIHRLACAAWPAYAAATPLLSFTLPMMVFRLALSTVCTLIAGAAVQRLTPSPWLPSAVGCALIILFAPEHYRIWSRLPVWYHLTFLASLVPLAVLGAHLAGTSKTAPARLLESK